MTPVAMVIGYAIIQNNSTNVSASNSTIVINTYINHIRVILKYWCQFLDQCAQNFTSLNSLEFEKLC